VLTHFLLLIGSLLWAQLDDLFHSCRLGSLKKLWLAGGLAGAG